MLNRAVVPHPQYILVTMLRQNLLRRLRTLRNLEFINIFYLPVCLYVVLRSLKIQIWQPYVYGMFLICIILAQGVLYWHLKLQVVNKKETALPSYFHPLFSFFRMANVLLILIYPALIIIDATTSWVQFQMSAGSNALFLFAVLEYVNYYYYQLSHDNWNDIRFLLMHKKIRRSPLYIDLQKSQERILRQEAGSYPAHR